MVSAANQGVRYVMYFCWNSISLPLLALLLVCTCAQELTYLQMFAPVEQGNREMSLQAQAGMPGQRRAATAGGALQDHWVSGSCVWQVACKQAQDQEKMCASSTR